MIEPRPDEVDLLCDLDPYVPVRRGFIPSEIKLAKYAKSVEVALDNVRDALADPEPKSFEAYLLGLANGDEPVE